MLKNSKMLDYMRNMPVWALILVNILAMCVVGCIIFWLATYFLDFWTHHGDEAKVPDAKGLYFDNAVAMLTEQGFVAELQDSIYEDGVAPGTVVEQNPRADSNVKPGRTVYLTVNAFYPRTVIVPHLIDISYRQAKTTLEGLGLKNITVKEVPSEYKDLVYGAFVDGKPLEAGMRVPLTARVVLEVGVGMPDEDILADTAIEGFALDVPQEVETPAPHVTHERPEQSPSVQPDDEPSYFD